jgi:aminoglycoside phosphotransferase (APT) family kinase protein
MTPRASGSRDGLLIAKMHVDEVEVDETLVRLLLAHQFPDWVDRPLHRVEPEGTDNAIFRLGDDLAVRLARRRGPTQPGGKLFEWLPTLAPLLPVAIPGPVAQGHPTLDYRWFWERKLITSAVSSLGRSAWM